MVSKRNADGTEPAAAAPCKHRPAHQGNDGASGGTHDCAHSEYQQSHEDRAAVAESVTQSSP